MPGHRKNRGSRRDRRVKYLRKKLLETHINGKERHRNLRDNMHIAAIEAHITRFEHMNSPALEKERQIYVQRLKSKKYPPAMIQLYEEMPLERFRRNAIAHFERRLQYLEGNENENELP